MLGFSIFVLGVSYIFIRAFGYSLMTLGFMLIFVGLINLFSYYNSDKIALALARAKPIKKSDNPTLFRTVENLSIAAGLPRPRIYIINDASPNAFATGRDPKHSAVAVTTGLLDKLDKLELEGVLSHELSHIGNYDTRLMAVVVILVGVVAVLSDFFLRMTFFGGLGRDRENRQAAALFMALALVAAILAPIAAQLIKVAISRKREFLADASGALLTRYPEGLARALEKIAQDPHPLRSASTATAHMYIENPLKKHKRDGLGRLANLFNTHPPVEERIKALRAMA